MNKYNFLLECHIFWSSFLVQFVLLSPLYDTSQKFQEFAVFLWDEADEFVDMLKKDTLSYNHNIN